MAELYEGQDIKRIDGLLRNGKMSKKVESKLRELKKAINKGDSKKRFEISQEVHQNISGSMDAKKYPLRENQNFNSYRVGTSVYNLTDEIAHRGY